MDRVSEHVAAHPYYLEGVGDERARAIKLIMDRLDHIYDIAVDMKYQKDADLWPDYLRGMFMELCRMVEVIEGRLPVKSDPTV